MSISVGSQIVLRASDAAHLESMPYGLFVSFSGAISRWSMQASEWQRRRLIRQLNRGVSFEDLVFLDRQWTTGGISQLLTDGLEKRWLTKTRLELELDATESAFACVLRIGDRELLVPPDTSPDLGLCELSEEVRQAAATLGRPRVLYWGERMQWRALSAIQACLREVSVIVAARLLDKLLIAHFPLSTPACLECAVLPLPAVFV